MLIKTFDLRSLDTPSQITKRLTERVRQPIWPDRFGLTPRQYWLGKVSADTFMLYRHANAFCRLHGVISSIAHHAGSRIVVQVRLVWGQVLWSCFAVLMMGFIAYKEQLFEPIWLVVMIGILPIAMVSDVLLSIRRLKAELSVVSF